MEKGKKDPLDYFDPERREFIKKMTAAAFVIPTVVSVSMFEQKFDLSSAQAAGDPGPAIRMLLLDGSY